MANRNIRTSDLVTDKDGKLSLPKVAAAITIVTALGVASVAAASHFLRGDRHAQCIERIESKQDEDHDTLIEVKADVKHIQTEQSEMRADVKLILQKIERNGS